MLSKRYADASVEVLNILNHMSDTDLSKVSNKFISFLRKNASKDYIPNLDYSKSLKDMNLKEETRGLLTIMYKKYWCSEEDKTNLQRKLYINEQVYQKKLREKYNPDNIFKKDSDEDFENNDLKQIYVEEESFLGKIKTFFKIILY